MKKLLISLTILFSLFLGVNSVSAYTTATYHSTSDDWVYINTLNMTQEEINVYSEKYVSYNASATETAIKRILAAREYYNNYYSDKYSYYIITANMAQSSPWIYLFVFNEFPYSSYYLEAPYVVNGTGYLNYNSIFFRFDNSDTSLYKLFYTSNGTKFSERPSYENNVLILNNSSSSSLKYLSNYYETNYSFDVRLNPEKGTGTAYYDVFYYDNKVYQNGDILFNTLEKNNMNIVKENKPKIKMSLIEKQEDFTKVNINFSEFDREKYIYLYNFNNQPGLENWHEIINNDYIYKAIINGTLYVQVIDKAKFNETKEIETIVSATYTFSDLLINEDIIDISTISNNSEIEYRYYGSTPAKFYVSSYRYGELPENVNCIVGTGIYECNIFNIMDIQSTYSFYSYAKNEVTGEDVYVKKYGYNDSPGYNSQIYEFYSKEDFTKYPITCVDNTSDCWSNNYYRSFTIDLTTYINSSSQYKSNYIYVYYNANIYDKSWNGSLNRNGTLEDFTEDNIKPPTYQESNSSFIQGFNDWFAPIIELINKKFPIIAQIGTILSSIFVNNHEDITNIEVDLSFLGMNQKYKLIDINAYKDVKDIIFFFEYCSILMIAIPKIIKNIKESFSD